MHRYLAFLLLSILLVASCGCMNQPAMQQSLESPPAVEKPIEVPEKIRKEMTAVEKFFEPMNEPCWMDWLATNPENGQTFEQYLNSNPT